MAYVLSLHQQAEIPNKTFTTADACLQTRPAPPSVKPEGCFRSSLPTVPKVTRPAKLVLRVAQSFPDVFAKKAFPP